MSVEEHQLHVDLPDIDFSLFELMEKQQKVFMFTSKNLFEPCNYSAALIFITLSVLIIMFLKS